MARREPLRRGAVVGHLDAVGDQRPVPLHQRHLVLAEQGLDAAGLLRRHLAAARDHAGEVESQPVRDHPT